MSLLVSVDGTAAACLLFIFASTALLQTVVCSDCSRMASSFARISRRPLPRMSIRLQLWLRPRHGSPERELELACHTWGVTSYEPSILENMLANNHHHQHRHCMGNISAERDIERNLFSRVSFHRLSMHISIIIVAGWRRRRQQEEASPTSSGSKRAVP